MRYLGTVLATLAAGAWIGGIVCIAIFAASTFKTLGPDQRELAGTVTSRMFVLFGWVQLGCAATGLIGAFLIYLKGRRFPATIAFIAFALAAGGAVAYSMWLVPKMESLRTAGQSTGDEFTKLHHVSRYLLQGVAGALIVALAAIPGAGEKRAA